MIPLQEGYYDLFLGCAIVIVLAIFIMRMMDISEAYSKGLALAIVFSILAAISLSQNYTESLIPGINDGIAVSNSLAFWILGDDSRWSQELFMEAFDRSILFTLFLVITYLFVLVGETRLVRKR